MHEDDVFYEMASTLADVLDPKTWSQVVDHIIRARTDQVVGGAVAHIMAGIGEYVDDPDALAEHLTRLLRTEVVDVLLDAYEDAGRRA